MKGPFLAGAMFAAGDALSEFLGAICIVLTLIWLYVAFRDGWRRG
tara:strand:- start:806 stop:940 length:135 start_codon:yes stop_codon:yes gene_type:complete